ncbi:MAG: endonuclease III [Eubacteriales bacterium]
MESGRKEEVKTRAGLADSAGEIFKRLGEAYPGAATALVYRNPFELLVAAILSAQCTDSRVNQITARLFKKYRSPQDFAGLSPEALAEKIKGCGLHHSKSRYIVEASRAIQERHGGKIPTAREELEALPGVGRKTAGVVLGVAYGADTLPVDTHVFRVAHRLGLSTGKGPDNVERDLLACVPPGARQAAHHRLIRHGREVCSARRPRCGACILWDVCPSRGSKFEVRG